MIYLWQYFLEDNLDAFRHYLADAAFNVGSHKGPGSHTSHKGGSSTLPSTSPATTFIRSRKSLENTGRASRTAWKQDQKSHQVNLTRADINAKDAYGRTLLHLAASSPSPSAFGFVEALLQTPFIDLYIQDLESGWTALHRALYHGHVSIAQALMLRDIDDPTDYASTIVPHVSGGLVKIKDHEGNSPFEVFALTIAARNLQHPSLAISPSNPEDSISVNSVDADDAGVADRSSKHLVKPRTNLLGDEVFAFGSNKNLNLGLGDEDDRQFPEQVTLTRPEQLLHRLHVDAQVRRSKDFWNQDLFSSQSMTLLANRLPAIVKHQRFVIQDVIMSKLHTAVITNDPESNVYVCGFGPGGRLGTGDESTRFSYVCLQAGGLSKKHVVVVALGQDHSIAVCEQGEVFTWGSNRYGQLGYTLPQPSSTTNDYPTQLTPRQLFGSLKKEMIVGAAASSLHSVIFSSVALYAFGKNEGQLGLIDADARSLEMQVIPRRVGVSILQSPILMVSAIDRATTILLESHEVIVLTHFGWTKVVFQLEGFTNYFLNGSSATRYDPAGNFVSKITSGGNSICALSTFGEVFSIDVSKKQDALATNQSTTNPSKARNSLPQPSKLWSIGKSHMSARDIAVGQDGSIILCTASGSVWRKEKRTKIKQASTKGNATKMKDYKFARIPGINRAVGVRSNAYGAYTAIRKDCDVMREQIIVDPQSIWDTMFTMLPFKDLASPSHGEDSDMENPRPRFWTPATGSSSPAHIKQAILVSTDIEGQVQKLLARHELMVESEYDLWITSSVGGVRIPAHSFIVKARSRVLRQALASFQQSYYFSIPDVLSIEYGPDGQINVIFLGADFVTILNYVFYLYTENIADVWHHTQKRPHMATKYRQVRSDLMKIGATLEMRCLERAARVMTEPAKCLHIDMDIAFNDPTLFKDADVRIELANAVETKAHSAVLSRRCPFFEGLFIGRAGGSWLRDRRDRANENSDLVRVDLKHVEEQIFRVVLRHIYADTGVEIFDEVVTAGLDEFIDFIIEVMALSNELMLDRLTQVCQKVLGQYVTTRNVCQLLNAVAPCSVNEFKHAALEYICLNLETMLEHRLLEELDEDLLMELDQMVRENQLACLPFARSGRAEAELFDQYPELVPQIVQGKQRMVDSLRLRSRLLESEDRVLSAQKSRSEGLERGSLTSPSSINKQSVKVDKHTAVANPATASKVHGSDMLFEMDDGHEFECSVESPALSSTTDTKYRNDEALPDNVPPLPHWQHAPRGPGSSVHPQPQGPAGSPSGSSLRQDRLSTSTLGKHPGVLVDKSAGTETLVKAWDSPLAGPAKTNFQDIMAQTASKTSNLTLAINHRDAQMKRAPQRQSQRERKKIQHQQSQEKVRDPPNEVLSNPDSPISSHKPKSPWQILPKGPRSSSSQNEAPPDSFSQHSSPRPAMTMRQTVAGSSTSPIEITPAKPKPHPRSVSTPSVGRSSEHKPQIQSIRHTSATPTVSSSPLNVYHSMADILAQQEGEKTAIKEAAAKRSLQDIQQEQEFQEWWDTEAKKVQEEEQASAAAAARAMANRGEGGRRRGGRKKGSGRGGGGGGASSNDPEIRIATTARPSQGDDKARGQSQKKARGKGERGQGRGH
ncbi:hypothetical protein GJ744_002174 [Endocarpon pusillum]|uniref:BTB domain-containing protein n=1 Tax=Endocarpon pusillum TaxID=364733 RepID=A0A8H7AAL5_9EURO|nr:hypothetical protein GJ744_002174 [Endocarpon pusillum]